MNPNHIVLSIKKISSPFLHDIFKTILVYDADNIKKELHKKLGGKLLSDDWKLIHSYPEPRPTRRRKGVIKKPADAIWILKSRLYEKEDLTRFIIHEVKTGSFSTDELINIYSNLYFTDKRMKAMCCSGTPLFIWAWHINSVHRERNFKILPLEWLIPATEKRLNEILDVKEVYSHDS